MGRLPPAASTPDRRSLLVRALMVAGLASAYGTFAAMAVRFLLPARRALERWLFVARVADLPPGSSRPWTTPAGEPVTVARIGPGEHESDFIALSSTCPHLGCQVHWEAHRQRFFCPCHNGVFDELGNAVSGPPADAGQRLAAYPLQIEQGLVSIRVPVEGLTVPRGRRDGAR
jgi:cytochrome b6-f complex iron-sulfur subunit